MENMNINEKIHYSGPGHSKKKRTRTHTNWLDQMNEQQDHKLLEEQERLLKGLFVNSIEYINISNDW